MRKETILGVVFLCAWLPTGTFLAQTEVLLQEIEVYDPLLSVSILASEQAGDCVAPLVEQWPTPPGIITCYIVGGTDNGNAVAADGAHINWFVDSQSSDPSCPILGGNALRVLVTRPDGVTEEVIRVYTHRSFDCDLSNCGTRLTAGGVRVTYDLTNGTLLFDRTAQITDCNTGQDLEQDTGVIAVTGFPRLFDTLLTFVPDGQSLSLLTAAHPDGFGAADSLQLWTGNVGTLPDWAQAQPLACPAATDPTPGQVVTVADTLPNPPVGQARFYIAASEQSADLRLGREYVAGAFSPRDPSSLPACQ